MCDALPDYCMRPPVNDAAEGVSHADFIKLVGSVPFVACAHGGGERKFAVIDMCVRAVTARAYYLVPHAASYLIKV
jgi:hypothetical protein